VWLVGPTAERTDELCRGEGPEGFHDYRQAVEASRFLVGDPQGGGLRAHGRLPSMPNLRGRARPRAKGCLPGGFETPSREGSINPAAIQNPWSIMHLSGIMLTIPV
jgi:hypothetical protein